MTTQIPLVNLFGDPSLFVFVWGEQSPHAPRNANREHGVAMFPVRIS